MRILVLNYEYPPIGGGAGVTCRDLCQIAESNNIHIEVVTMLFKGIAEKEIVEGVTLHRVKCIRTKMRVCYPWEQFSYCLSAYRYIRKNIDIGKFDLIHCHFIVPTGLLAMWLKKKYKIKYIITAHGSDVLGHNNTRFGVLYKLIKPEWIRILKMADAITAPSQYLVKKIKESCPTIQCIHIPNGINVDEYHHGKKGKSIITLARLQESKGIQDLIEACSEIDLGDWKINILGDGPYKKSLENLIIKKNLQEKIFLRGHIIGAEKVRYLSEAGIFFSGSRFESFALSVLEASISKCWILASDIEPHRILVGSEHIYSTIEELKRKLVLAINMEPHCTEYGNEKYDWKIVFEKYKSLYKLIGESE